MYSETPGSVLVQQLRPEEGVQPHKHRICIVERCSSESVENEPPDEDYRTRECHTVSPERRKLILDFPSSVTHVGP